MFHTEILDVNMGPQHPATHGVLRVILGLDGETVVECKPVIGYLHRGVEKLSEAKTYQMVPPLCDRLDSHLVWLGTHGLDIGAMTVFFYCFREREMVLDLFEAFCGARLTTNMFRIGGTLEDLPPGWVEGCRRFIDILPSRIQEYEGLLSQNRIWLERTKGVGIISAEDAVNWGVTGPCLRASGVAYDLRKAMPYAAYAQMEFDIPTGSECDTYDRYLVRTEEMRQSVRIIRQALDNLPDGDFRHPKVPKKIRPPAGEVYHVIEGPRGEQGFYIKSDGTEKPYRMRFRSPSFVNLQALPLMTKGSLIADVVAVIGTLDIVLGDSDR
jgi:NADH-quinone oxidoreductase subunit D